MIRIIRTKTLRALRADAGATRTEVERLRDSGDPMTTALARLLASRGEQVEAAAIGAAPTCGS